MRHAACWGGGLCRPVSAVPRCLSTEPRRERPPSRARVRAPRAPQGSFTSRFRVSLQRVAEGRQTVHISRQRAARETYTSQVVFERRSCRGKECALAAQLPFGTCVWHAESYLAMRSLVSGNASVVRTNKSGLTGASPLDSLSVPFHTLIVMCDGHRSAQVVRFKLSTRSFGRTVRMGEDDDEKRGWFRSSKPSDGRWQFVRPSDRVSADARARNRRALRFRLRGSKRMVSSLSEPCLPDKITNNSSCVRVAPVDDSAGTLGRVKGSLRRCAPLTRPARSRAG
jgi:hypothetical protein